MQNCYSWRKQSILDYVAQSSQQSQMLHLFLWFLVLASGSELNFRTRAFSVWDIRHTQTYNNISGNKFQFDLFAQIVKKMKFDSKENWSTALSLDWRGQPIKFHYIGGEKRRELVGFLLFSRDALALKWSDMEGKPGQKFKSLQPHTYIQ